MIFLVGVAVAVVVEGAVEEVEEEGGVVVRVDEVEGAEEVGGVEVREVHQGLGRVGDRVGERSGRRVESGNLRWTWRWTWAWAWAWTWARTCGTDHYHVGMSILWHQCSTALG